MTETTRIKFASPAALAALALLVLAAPAAAKTLKVTSAEESGPGSLGAVILEAQAGDTIRLRSGTYVLTNGEYLVAKGLTLRGVGEGATTIEPSGGGEALADPNVAVVDATIGEPRQPSGGESNGGARIESKTQIVALVATLAILLLVLELVRRRRLAERYALLWMLAAVALLVLAIWTDGLGVIADAMGIAEPANAIFILAFAVAFVLLLHFSVATSRLSDETRILAQEVARQDLELRKARGGAGRPNSARTDSRASGAKQLEADGP